MAFFKQCQVRRYCERNFKLVKLYDERQKEPKLDQVGLDMGAAKTPESDIEKLDRENIYSAFSWFGSMRMHDHPFVLLS